MLESVCRVALFLGWTFSQQGYSQICFKFIFTNLQKARLSFSIVKRSFSAIMNDSFWAHKVLISKPRDWIMKACLRIPKSGPRKKFTKMFSCSTSSARQETRQELTWYESLNVKHRIASIKAKHEKLRNAKEKSMWNW